MSKKAVAKKAADKPVSQNQPDRAQRILADPVMNHTVGRLASVMRQPGAAQPTDSELNFGVAMFGRLAPTDAAESLLCSQMVATHEVALELLTRAKQAGEVPQLEANGALALKLLGMFERQFATLQRNRRPPQKVTVEHTHRHVHVNASGKPDPTGGPGDVSIIEGQAHEATDTRALALAGSPALHGQDAPRDALPVTSDTERPMPDARRRARKRSA